MSERNENSLRGLLLAQTKRKLVSFFVNNGFALLPLPKNEQSPELSVAFPLGRLKRRSGTDLHVVEIQFDKHKKPKFVINFGIVPDSGVALPWGAHLTQDEADVCALPDAYRLYSSSFRLKWFQLGMFSTGDEASAALLVDDSIVLSEQIINWFETRKVGSHMRHFGIR